MGCGASSEADKKKDGQKKDEEEPQTFGEKVSSVFSAGCKYASERYQRAKAATKKALGMGCEYDEERDIPGQPPVPPPPVSDEADDSGWDKKQEQLRKDREAAAAADAEERKIREEQLAKERLRREEEAEARQQLQYQLNSTEDREYQDRDWIDDAEAENWSSIMEREVEERAVVTEQMSAKAAANLIEVRVRTLLGSDDMLIRVGDEATILELKQRIEAEYSHAVAAQRLIFSGKQLENDQTLKGYNIGSGDILHMVLKLEKKGGEQDNKPAEPPVETPKGDADPAAEAQRRAEAEQRAQAEAAAKQAAATERMKQIYGKMITQCVGREESSRRNIDNRADVEFNNLMTQCASQAAAMVRGQQERQERERREREQAERAAREAEKRRLREQQREAERRRKAEEAAEAARIAAASAAEKARLEAEAAEAAKRREEEAQRLREQEEAQKRADEERKQREAAERKQRRASKIQEQPDDDDNDADDVSDGEDVEIKPQPTMDGPMDLLFKQIECYMIKGKDGANEKWGFFNATTEHELHVTWTFSPSCDITTLGTTKGEKEADGWLKCTDVIYPGDTNEFMKGKVNGYKSSYTAKGVSPEYKAQLAAKRTKMIEQETAAVSKLGENDPEDRLRACVAKNIPYVDLEFPPGPSALAREEDRRQIEAVPFARPQWYLNAGIKPRLFKSKIEPNDIDQGQLGDCWFLCSVAALAEFPDKVQDTFAHPHPKPKKRAKLLRKEQAVGAFRVCINKGGWWSNYIIDSYVPAVGGPIFARNNEEPNELWVSLLEKAYAKAHGSYAAIVSGDATKALQDLTGFPARSFDKEIADAGQRDALFEKLQAWDDEGYAMSVSCPGNEANPTAQYKNVGLVTGHAYTLLRVVTVKKKKLRLCQIRNPWGNDKEWNGAWSDADGMWKKHPDVAKLCGHTASADGAFWMTWEDVCKYFTGGGVCYMKTNWFDYRIQSAIAPKHADHVMVITVKSAVNVFLMLSQPCTRANPDHKQQAIQLCLGESADKKTNKYKYTAFSTSDALAPSPSLSPFMFGRDVSMLRRLNPTPAGKPYVVVPRVFDEGTTTEIVLGLISESPVGDAFTVEFKRLPDGDRAFDNYPTFDLDAASLPSATADYQANTDHGAPVTYRGDCLSK